MNRHIRIFNFSILFAALLLTGCRDDADHLLSYGQSDNLAFNDAQNSFAEKFNILWEGMNCNYSLWDYEASFGLDWDKVYDEYMPRFKALDERTDSVKDDELRALLTEVVAPLHDGHLVIQMQNHHTGKYLTLSPNSLRNEKERADYQPSNQFRPRLQGYLQGENALLDYALCSTNIGETYSQVDTMTVLNKIAQLEAIARPTDLEQFLLTELQSFMAEYRAVVYSADPIGDFNRLSTRYEAYQIPGLTTYDAAAAEYDLQLKYALFPGNIAYFYLSGFLLSAWIDDGVSASYFPNPSECIKRLKKNVLTVWLKWFTTVQRLHKEGKLGGVIVDVRGNGGGMVNDYQYVMGSLIPNEVFKVGDARFKNGVGRYDYSVLMPQVMNPLNVEREAITEPIVVLSNCMSVSMSESTAITAKLLDNGRLIGTQTWGGLCFLTSDPKDYSLTYASSIGEKNKTPVYCYIPMMALFVDGMGIREGVGITPDIEVPLDVTLFQQGRDSQLERALQYIRTGN